MLVQLEPGPFYFIFHQTDARFDTLRALLRAFLRDGYRCPWLFLLTLPTLIRTFVNRALARVIDAETLSFTLSFYPHSPRGILHHFSDPFRVLERIGDDVVVHTINQKAFGHLRTHYSLIYS